jgi:hypothetical protein
VFHHRSRPGQVITSLILFIGLCYTVSVKADQWGDWTYTTDGSNVTITGYGGTNEDLVIPDVVSNMTVVSIWNYAFTNKTSLTNITIPNSVSTIGVSAFESCSNLKSVTIGTGVTNIGDRAFFACNTYTNSGVDGGGTIYWWFISMESVIFKGNSPVIGSEVFDGDIDTVIYYYPWTSGWTNTYGGRPTVPLDISYVVDNGTVTITGYTGTNSFLSIPNTISNLPVVSIGNTAFQNITNLNCVTMGDSVVNIGDGAFSNCVSLVYALMGNSVTNVGENAFRDCVNLASIVIPDSVRALDDRAFFQCASLTNVVLGANVSYIGFSEFYGCVSLPGIFIPRSVRRIMDWAFDKCNNLSAIIVEAASTNYHSVDGVLFDIYGGNTILVCFPGGKGGCYVIPDGVRAVEPFAFDNCSFLNNVIFPSSITFVGDYSLPNCINLASASFRGNAPLTYSGAFLNSSNVVIYYYPWTSGWTDTYGGRPTQINPDYTQWLLNNNFSTNGIEATTNDFDNDGMLNWQEYLAGTSPTNDADRLAISSMGSGSNLSLISWQAKSNVSYQVMRCSDLQDTWGTAPSGPGTNQQAQQTAVTNQILQYMDSGYLGVSNAFYRVNVVP